MDENRAYDRACANHQRNKDRELMILRHLFHHHTGPPRIHDALDRDE
jgi:hypothetical protein